MFSCQIIESAPYYALKYDEILDTLRDQTFSELKAMFGKNNKIKCNCWGDRNREYKVDTPFIATHIKSQKHINWREEQIKEHKKNYGHCISSEKIIEIQRKELREYKKMHADSVQVITNKNEKLELMSKKLDEVSLEKESLLNKFEEYREELNKYKEELEKFKKEPAELEIIKKENTNLKQELEDVGVEVEILQQELEEYQKDIIVISQERDKLKYEHTNHKLTIIGKKKGSITPIVKKAFR